MVGIGTMMQDPYGWVVDSSGDPELYVWHGAVYQGLTDAYANPIESARLYKVIFNKNGQGNHDGTIGFSLVSDLTSTYTADLKNFYPGFTFISRDVFLCGQHYRSSEFTYAQPLWTYIWANKLNSNGTSVTTKIWNRKLIKSGQTDPDVSGGTENNWPGKLAGLSYVAPESEYYDTVRKNGSVIALTACWPYNGPYGWAAADVDPDLGGDPKNQILKLDTDDEKINNNYYEDSDSFKEGADVGGGESSTTSAWDLVKQIGNGSNQLDSFEGWCSLDSKGNLYYGNALFYFANTVGGDNIMETDHTYGSNDSIFNSAGNYVRHSIMRISSPLSGGINNRTVMHFNNGLSDSNAMDNPGLGWDFNLKNFLEADGGCFDIYGQTVHGKDSLWLMVNRNHKKIVGTNVGTYNADREGLWVLKDNGGDNKFDVLQHYTFDSSYPFTHDNNPDDTSTYWVGEGGMSFRPASKR